MIKRVMYLGVMASALAGDMSWGQELVADAELKGLDYYTYWRAHLPLQPGEQLQTLSLVDNKLYGVTTEKRLYALQAEVGAIEWSAPLGGRGTRVFKPSHVRGFWGRDLTLVATSDHLKWLDAGTGATVYTLDTPFVPCTAAVSDGVRVYVGGLDALLHCYQFIPTPRGVSTIERWQVRAVPRISAAPVVWDGALFFAAQNGRVNCCNASDKIRFWVFNAPGGITHDFHVDSTGVYFACKDNSIGRVDVDSGRGSWRVQAPGPLEAPPLLIGDLLIQKVTGHGMLALDADSGQQAWHAPSAEAFVSATPDRMHMLTRFGDIIAVDLESVEIDAQVFAGDVELVISNTLNGAMYFANGRGAIQCAQPSNVPFLRFSRLQEDRPPVESSSTIREQPEQASSGNKTPARLRELLRSKQDVPAPSGG